MNLKKLIRIVIKKAAIVLYNVEFKCFPIRKNVIVMSSNMGRNYTGNPKAIYEEMIRRGLDRKYKIVWFFENIRNDIPGNAIKVKVDRFRYLYYMAVAKVWIFDCRQPMFIKKKEKSVYIQTWHGTPLKKLALDMEDVSMAGEDTIEEYKENFRKNTSTWDYLISQNNFSTEIFRRCFDFKKEMLEIGYPRNDVLINSNTDKYKRNIRKELGLPMDKKVILYAPTWRDNQYYRQGEYKFNMSLDFDKARRELEYEYVFIVKYHYLVKDSIDWTPYKGFVYDFDMEYDISKLYIAADILITDYSSVMFDYSLLKRPILFYAYDLEEYKNKLRGFYFDFLAEAPGPISMDTDSLIKDIMACTGEKMKQEYDKRYSAFLNKYNHIDDGKASEHIVNLVEKIIENH